MRILRAKSLEVGLFDDFIAYGDHLEAFVAYPSLQKRPLVILCHAWSGRDDFICEKARAIAAWGYVGFALDMYGKGVFGRSKEENLALKKPFVEDRAALRRRVMEGFEVACALPFVDTQRIAVLGYGFGGICALDLALSGVSLNGAISVYGHVDLMRPVDVRVLILHGEDDPIVRADEVLRLKNEGCEVHLYKGAMHAFASPGANDPASGILYHPVAAEKSWQTIQRFLREIFV